MARYVTRFGGAAHPVGKPYPYIYEEALRRCAPAGRVLAVGDSMAHDVAGANRAGVDSALVCWGIHAADVGVAPGSAAVPLDAGSLRRAQRDACVRDLVGGRRDGVGDFFIQSSRALVV